MTIDEAIERENAIIKNEQFFQDTHIVFTDDDGEDVTIEMLHCDDTECIEESLEISKYNLEYHQQLVRWLEELKLMYNLDKTNFSDGYERGWADALDIDMDEPMHFTDKQKAWIKNYIVINAKRQRSDAIEECIAIVKNGYRMDALEKLKQLKEQNNGMG